MRKILTAITLVAAGVLLNGVGAAAASTTVVVTPANFTTVFTSQTEIATASHQFVTGPATPPLGAGSLELTTVDNPGHLQYLERAQLGTLLSAITQMAYSTYRHSASTGGAQVEAAINLEIFNNISGANTGYTTMVFEPYLNPSLGTVMSDSWQSWDAYSGGAALWHSTHTVGSIPAGQAAPWSAFLAQAPNATVLGYGPNQGSFNPGIISNVDKLIFGTATDTTTYDFEPTPSTAVPESPMALMVVLVAPVAGIGLITLRRRRQGQA